MNFLKKLLAVLLLFILLGTVAAGIYWHTQTYMMVDFKFYPKEAELLDLRDREITVRHYEKLRRRLPECQILWTVPVQGERYSEDTKKITVEALDTGDIEAMKYLPELKTVSARSCTDYDVLLKLQERYPDLEVIYKVQINGRAYSQNGARVILTEVTEEDLALLQYLPQLSRVDVAADAGAEQAGKVQSLCAAEGWSFGVMFGDTVYLESDRDVTLTGVTEAQLEMLQFLPRIETLHFAAPQVDAKLLMQLREEYPNAAISWDAKVCGLTFRSDAEEVDLSTVAIRSLTEVEQAMQYLPDAKTVFLGECSFDNEAIAAYRDRVREDYKVVWVVQCGDKLKTRTDATTFMPTREKVFYFNDEEAYNLRYCEDLVALDIGHMSIHNIDFVEFMPDLEYLILAHTQLQYIEPIKHCKKLKFLELDWSPIKDYSPLLGCTGLEDLNIGNTFAPIDPICQMTWLKNVWMNCTSSGRAYKVSQALPDATVMSAAPLTVGGGWRKLPNYYAMRDLLGMEYMSG